MMKWGIISVAIAFLLCTTGVVIERTFDKLSTMLSDARTNAFSERDAHWQAEIAKSNLEVAKAQADQAEQIAAVSAAADDKIALAERQLLELRKDSDALPDNADSCGLSADGVQLLNR